MIGRSPCSTPLLTNQASQRARHRVPVHFLRADKHTVRHRGLSVAYLRLKGGWIIIGAVFDPKKEIVGKIAAGCV